MLLTTQDHRKKIQSKPFMQKLTSEKSNGCFAVLYNPTKNNIHAHLENLDKSLVLYSSSYENHIIMCDFNVGTGNT